MNQRLSFLILIVSVMLIVACSSDTVEAPTPTTEPPPSDDIPATKPLPATPTPTPATEPPLVIPDPGSKMIAFTSERGGKSGLYVMDANGTNTRQIATPELGFIAAPAWSPDGQRIAYPVITSGDHGPLEVWVVTLDGSEQIKVSEAIPDKITAAYWPTPTWSPDGTRIAFMAVTQDEAGKQVSMIYVVRADGGSLEQRIAAPFDVFSVDWSPAGDWLLLTGASADGTISAFVLSAENWEIDDLYQDTWAADWSPDGTEIVVGNQSTGEIIVLGEGGESRMVAQVEGKPASADWSPDGAYLLIGVFAPNRWKTNTLYLVSVATGETTLIITEGDFYHANWSQNGQAIMFLSMSPSYVGSLWVYLIASGDLLQLTPDKVSDGFGVWSP